MEEIWKDIEGYEGLYQVSNFGRILSIRSHYILKGSMSSQGYKVTTLSKPNHKEAKRVLIHRLVAKSFVPNPQNKPQVNHIDGNKLNNNANNLEWVTGKENIQHTSKNKLLQKSRQIYEQIQEVDAGRKFKYTAKIPYWHAIPFNEILQEKGLTFEFWLDNVIADICQSKYTKINKYF